MENRLYHKDIAHLNKNIRITSISSLVVVTTIFLLLTAMCVWLFAGSVTEKSLARGLVFPIHGTTDITLPKGGKVRSLFVQKGQYVERGQRIALVSIGTSNSVITSNSDGAVFFMRQENVAFEPYDPIVSLVQSNTDAQLLKALIYCDLANFKNVAVGQEVQLWPSNQKRDEVGYVKGHISRVTNYPIDKHEAAKKLKIEGYANTVLPVTDPVFEIEVAFDVKADDPSAMNWTFSAVNHPDMSAGTICEAIIITSKTSVFQRLFMRSKANMNKAKEWME